jgi:hypothetical protein
VFEVLIVHTSYWGSGKVRIFKRLFVGLNNSNKNSKFCWKKIKKLGKELRRTFPRTLKNLAKNFEDSFEVLAKFWPSFFNVLGQVSLMFLANFIDIFKDDSVSHTIRFSSLKFDSNVSSGKLTTEMTEQQ